MKRLILAALLGAGCTTVPEAEAPAAETYGALGTEPFWSVSIADGRMIYEALDGPRFSVPAPVARPTFNGRRYETERLTLDISHGACSDGMSDRIFADTVMVIVEGRAMHGCGGEILPPATLAGTGWAMVAIDGRAVEGDAYFLQFDDGRISGRAGCNRFSATYTQSDATISPGPVMATRMACPEPNMTHERLVLDLLRGPVRFEHPDGDILLLTGHGRTVRLRRSI